MNNKILGKFAALSFLVQLSGPRNKNWESKAKKASSGLLLVYNCN